MILLDAVVLSFGIQAPEPAAPLAPLDPAMPAAWSQVIDTSPSGLAADVARYCPGRMDDCPTSFRDDRKRLAEAWASEATTASDKALMVATFRRNIAGGRLNWDFAALNYFGARQTAMYATGRAVAPIPRYLDAPSHRISGTVGCDTTVSRDGLHRRSTCWADPIE